MLAELKLDKEVESSLNLEVNLIFYILDGLYYNNGTAEIKITTGFQILTCGNSNIDIKFILIIL